MESTLGRKPDEVLNSTDRMPFYGFFRSKDGKVAIVALTARQWKDLAEAVGHPEMTVDPRFSNILAQIHHHEEAVSLIEAWTSSLTSREIIQILEGKKIPCGIAYSTEEVNRDENLGQRGMFSSVSHKIHGTIDVPGIPYHFSSSNGAIRSAAPQLGEHNRLILEGWLKYSQDEIDALYRDKVLV
jgi:crotonobetainyl-CoA:carnitine CoA-transferase CaiB-like acyl-CoA transferase